MSDDIKRLLRLTAILIRQLTDKLNGFCRLRICGERYFGDDEVIKHILSIT
jgi:hypothetical protein